VVPGNLVGLAVRTRQNRFQLHVLTFACGNFLHRLRRSPVPRSHPGRPVRKSACLANPPPVQPGQLLSVAVQGKNLAIGRLRQDDHVRGIEQILAEIALDPRFPAAFPAFGQNAPRRRSPAFPADATGQSPPCRGCRSRHRPDAERAAQSSPAPRQKRYARAMESHAPPGSCVAGARVPAAPTTAARRAKPPTRPASGPDRLVNIGTRLGEIVDHHQQS
jgi:hypothetical protein